MSAPETIPGIIAEMRGGPIPHHRRDQELLRHYAERIEAAYRAEKLRWVEANAGLAKLVDLEKIPTGKNAKMREALLCIGHIAEYLEAGTIRDFNHAYRNIQDRVKIALAEPPRNCDVGTIDNQIARHYEYCSSHLGDGDDPHCCGHISCSECVIRWEQKEYKEEARQ